MPVQIYWRCPDPSCKCIVVGSAPYQVRQNCLDHIYDEHEDQVGEEIDFILHFSTKGVIELDR